MATRSMVGLRKGGAPVVEGAGDEMPDGIGGAPPTGPGEPATCPNCQCVFDPASGEIVAPPPGAGGEGGPPAGGGVPDDLLAQLAASMGGPG